MKCVDCRFFKQHHHYHTYNTEGVCNIVMPAIVDTWGKRNEVFRGQGCSFGKPRWIWIW